MGGESGAHRALKRAALLWAQREGYRACGVEVRLPNSRYVADVAACRLERDGDGEGGTRVGATAVFECKQSRPDFLSDAKGERESVGRLRELNARRVKLEELLGLHYPHLRRGDSLFPEYQSTAAGELRHEGYRKLMGEIGRVERAVYGRTKFDKLVRYGCANLFYVVARRGILRETELPPGWGLMCPAEEVEGEEGAGSAAALEVVCQPCWVETEGGRGVELLHQLALGGTRRVNAEAGIDFEEVWRGRAEWAE